jgi:phage/plasmid primase-like uncharacterized protein
MNYTFSEQRELVKARAGEVFALLGAENTPKHQRCIFADHNDQNPSFRIHGERYICSCGHGDAIDAVSRVTGLNHAQAVQWATERLSGGFRPVAARPNIVPAPISCNSYAAKLWAAADRDDAYVRQHPYAIKKQIDHAFGAGRTLVTGSVVGKQADCIVVPIREHGTGEVIAVQAINSDGRKQSFGTIGDGFLLTGDERDRGSYWVIVEGWASGYAVRASERLSVVAVSFGQGRLNKIYDFLKERYNPPLLGISEEPA